MSWQRYCHVVSGNVLRISDEHAFARWRNVDVVKDGRKPLTFEPILLRTAEPEPSRAYSNLHKRWICNTWRFIPR